ncbi:MAG: NAD(+)/NADH kinase [Rhodocyclaceae bacterium]|nr:NAD(+)/NADH kinase [Rhodocyclaceae bacterium]
MNFTTVALFAKAGSLEAGESLKTLVSWLEARKRRVLIDREIAYALDLAEKSADDARLVAEAELAIVVGGDGTLLSAARRLAGHAIPLVGINQGRLGFMTDIARADMLPALEDLLAGRFHADHRSLLEATVWREGQQIFRTLALNDVVVNKGDLGRMIELEVRVDDEFLYVLHADGMIVATPTGSTAYALSANGPILQPAVPGLALVPLCPHGLTHRPITIADRSRIRLSLISPQQARMHCDGQSHVDLATGDVVDISRASCVITLLHPPGYSYFAMLREKLHWSATPRRL